MKEQSMNLAKFILPLFFLASFPVLADESVPTRTGAKRVTPLEKDAIALAVLADQIAALGESTNDPLAYLLAAKIQKRLRINDAEAASGSSDSSRYAIYMERAKALAGENVPYQAIIQSVEETRMRGTLSGISQQRGTLNAGSSLSFKLTFKGGEDAGVALMLDSSHAAYGRRSEIDLDLYVRDEADRTICALEGPRVPEMCAWTPNTTGKFSALIVNRGQVEAPFLLNFR